MTASDPTEMHQDASYGLDLQVHRDLLGVDGIALSQSRTARFDEVGTRWNISVKALMHL